MYITLPASLSELIANAWDADATFVSIDENKDSNTICVKDDGIGMTFFDIQDSYLRIGRDRRKAENNDKTQSGRRVMGRKGLGKLAGFGIASTVSVKTCKDNEYTDFTIDFTQMTNCLDGNYEPPQMKF